MFEDLAQILTPQAARSRRLALPFAVAVHLALAAVLLLQAVYGPDSLAPPDLASGNLWSQPPQVSPPPSRAAVHKVILVKKSELEDHDAIRLPPTEVPDTIPIPDSADRRSTSGPSGDSDLPFIPGTIPSADGHGTGSSILPGTHRQRIIRQPWNITPPKLLQRVEPVYPLPARAMGLTGRVVLQLVVNEKGRVESATVVQASNPIFEDAALKAARRWLFTRPVDRDGQIVACYVTVVVRFNLH